jgi:hypothetical protein
MISMMVHEHGSKWSVIAGAICEASKALRVSPWLVSRGKSLMTDGSAASGVSADCAPAMRLSQRQ